MPSMFIRICSEVYRGRRDPDPGLGGYYSCLPFILQIRSAGFKPELPSMFCHICSGDYRGWPDPDAGLGGY